MMKEFGIKNFRSFDDNGVIIEKIKKINIIIGKNNCGKSNVLRFLQNIHLHINDLSKFPNDLTNQHRRNGQPVIFSLNIKDELISHYKSLFEKKNFFNYNFVWPDFGHVDFYLTSKSFELPQYILNLEEQDLYSLQTKYSKAGKSILLQAIKDEWKIIIDNKIKKSFEDLIYIYLIYVQ